MDFYEKKRRAGLDLAAWIKNDERGPFSALARSTLAAYGFGYNTLKKLLEENYPGLTVVNDELDKVQ